MTDPKLARQAAQRGNNLVCYAPPSPSAVREVLAGLSARELPDAGARILALAPAESIEEWVRVAGQTAPGQVGGARTPARLLRLLGSPTARLLITSPAAAQELVRRASLKPSVLGGLALLWPEFWGADFRVEEFLQDLAKETQRVIVTSDPAAAAPLVERYCWRAATVDLLGPAPAEPPGAVHSMAVAWGRRGAALLDLIEQLDPGSLAVWIADPADRDVVVRALEGSGTDALVSSEPPAPAPLVVAYDLPSPSELAALVAAGDSVLLVPPGTESYVARIAPKRRPLHAQGALELARAEVAAARRAIVSVVERGPEPSAFLVLAPLLERYEATAVAAALYEMWEAAPAHAAGGPSPPPPSWTRLWIGIGKRDAVTPHDLVAALIKSAGVGKDAIGKVDLRESFSLVEVAAPEPERVAERLTGQTIRKRRLVARVDQGRPAKR